MDPWNQDPAPTTEAKDTVSGFGAAHTISGDRLGSLSTSATPIKTK